MLAHLQAEQFTFTDTEQVKMATAKAKATEKPLIQIDDLVREMTDEEFAAHLEMQASLAPLPTGE